MSPALEQIELRPAVISAVQGVFRDMLSLPLEAADGSVLADLSERIVGSVGLGGETLTGVVFIQCSAVFAQKMAGALLMLPETEPAGESEINDAMSEISNIIAGGIKSYLCDTFSPCAVSTPSVIRGASFVVETGEAMRKDRFLFRSTGHGLIVEIHLQPA